MNLTHRRRSLRCTSQVAVTGDRWSVSANPRALPTAADLNHRRGTPVKPYRSYPSTPWLLFVGVAFVLAAFGIWWLGFQG